MSHPLFSCRYLPLPLTIGAGCIAIILTLLKFSQAQFTNLLSLDNWILVLSTQPLHAWLIVLFVVLCFIFIAQLKLIVFEHEISIEAFGMVFSHLAERTKIEKLQLYHHARSKTWVFKSLLPNRQKTLEDGWKNSILGCVLKPAYRAPHPLKRLELRLLSHADRHQLIQILARHWDLNPRSILGTDQLSYLVRRHKLR